MLILSLFIYKIKYTFTCQIKQFSGIINKLTTKNNISWLAKTEKKEQKGLKDKCTSH